MGKNVLIVYAHQEKRSFNAALLDAAVTTLQTEGHTVVVSDLYAMGFNPIMSRYDIKGEITPPEPKTIIIFEFIVTADF